MTTATFDPQTHTYFDLNGARVISVTQVIAAVGLVDDKWFTEEHRTRGNYVHKAIMYDEREGLDPASIDERLAGYVQAYRQFIVDVKPGPCQLLERPLFDGVLRYAGTPDQVREIRGKMALLDHKSGIKDRGHRLQTAGYDKLVRSQVPELNIPLARYALYLRPNGRYQLVEHKDRNDWKFFQAALAVARFKEEE